MTAVMSFTCSICGETSDEICVYCTNDTCANHLCERCKRCSDCCVCESPVIRETNIHHNVEHEPEETEHAAPEEVLEESEV